MITLYDYLSSQNAYKVRLLLNHLNQPYNSVYVSIFEGEGNTEAFRQVSPMATVPAIRLEDGRCLAESNAILMYLAEGSHYLPDDIFIRAKIFQWFCFEAENVQASVATLRHWVQTGKDQNRSAEMLGVKKAHSLKTLGILDKTLSEQTYLVGDSYTIADMAVFAYVHLAHEANLPLGQYQNLVRWIDSVKAQDGFLPEIHPYSIDRFSNRELS